MKPQKPGLGDDFPWSFQQVPTVFLEKFHQHSCDPASAFFWHGLAEKNDQVYPELLKRLDDSNDKIRVAVCEARAQLVDKSGTESGRAWRLCVTLNI